ncbi:MAG: DUF58 domain-containing protein [Lachnospiraceae bacterium]|nr:DUF58 domain-containing protein [Lachnospiraceae bacterium]
MIAVLLIGIIVIYIGWRRYYQKHWSCSFDARVQFAEGYVYAGEHTKLYEVVENRKRLPVPVLEVLFSARKELVFKDTENTNVSDYIYKRDIFSALGYQKITRQIDVVCTRRGYYTIDEVELKSYSMLYDKRYGIRIPNQTSLYVYPAKADISDIMMICEKMLGTLQCAKHLYEDPFAFRSIREYTLTDPMKTINWKASAKTGNLMVNTFDSALSEKVMIYLDIEDSGILKQDELVEDSISVAATLVRKLIAQGIEVGLYMNARYEDGSFLRLEPDSGRMQTDRVEKALALYQTEQGYIPFEKCLEVPPKDAVLVLISKNISVEQVKEFAGTEQFTIWIQPAYSNEVPDKPDVTNNIQWIAREVPRC